MIELSKLSIKELIFERNKIKEILKSVEAEMVKRPELGKFNETKSDAIQLTEEMSQTIMYEMKRIFISEPTRVFRFADIKSNLQLSGIVMNKTIETHVRNKLYSLMGTKFDIQIRKCFVMRGFIFKQLNEHT